MAIKTLKKFHPGHYTRGAGELDLADLTLALANGFVGARVDLPWARLEPQRGEYDFALITEYLRWGEVNNRHLVFMLFDRDFKRPGASSRIVPRWLNAAGQVAPFNAKVDNAGCVAKIWLSQVNDYRIELLTAIAAAFDDHPNLEAISLQETALGGISPTTQRDYSHAAYSSEIVRLIHAVAPVLRQTQLWQSINWLGPKDAPYLANIAAAMQQTRAGGLTNPDSVPWQPTEKPMYAVMQANAAAIPVAFGNDTSQLDKPGGRYTDFTQLVQMIFNFAQERGAHYVIWNNGFVSQAAQGAGLGREYMAAVKALVERQAMIVDVPTTMLAEPDPPPDPTVDLVALRAWLKEAADLPAQIEAWLAKGRVLVG